MNGHVTFVTFVTFVTISEDGAVRAGRCRRPPGYECGGDAAHPASASRPATASARGGTHVVRCLVARHVDLSCPEPEACSTLGAPDGDRRHRESLVIHAAARDCRVPLTSNNNLQADTACVCASSAQPRLLLLLWGRAFSAGSPPPVFLPIEQPEFQWT